MDHLCFAHRMKCLDGLSGWSAEGPLPCFDDYPKELWTDEDKARYEDVNRNISECLANSEVEEFYLLSPIEKILYNIKIFFISLWDRLNR